MFGGNLCSYNSERYSTRELDNYKLLEDNIMRVLNVQRVDLRRLPGYFYQIVSEITSATFCAKILCAAPMWKGGQSPHGYILSDTTKMDILAGW